MKMKGLHACVAHGLRTLTVRRTAARGLSVAVPAVQEIHAQLRTEAGSRRSGELRDNGRLPSLLYGVGHDGALRNALGGDPRVGLVRDGDAREPRAGERARTRPAFRLLLARVRI